MAHEKGKRKSQRRQLVMQVKLVFVVVFIIASPAGGNCNRVGWFPL